MQNIQFIASLNKNFPKLTQKLHAATEKEVHHRAGDMSLVQLCSLCNCVAVYPVFLGVMCPCIYMASTFLYLRITSSGSSTKEKIRQRH